MIGGLQPLVIGNVALILVDLDHIVVWQLDEPHHHLEPLRDQLSPFVRCNKVAFVGQMPDIFGVVFFIDLPIDRSSVLNTPIKKHFGNVSEPVEDILAWIATYLLDPLESFEEDEGSIEVYASMLAYQGKPIEIAHSGVICL